MPSINREITVSELFEQAALSRQDRWIIPARQAKELIESGKCIKVFYSQTSPAIIVEEI